MAPSPSPVSFTVRRPTPVSRPSSSGPESDSGFRIPALPRHLASAGGSATSSPLAGSPRTFSSREESDDDGEAGIIFADGAGADNQSHRTDSSDEDNFVVSSRQLGGQRKKKKTPDSQGPLVIPAQPNPDWREAARRRRAGCSRTQPRTPSFVPVSAVATTGADGSVGGLGTRDTINSGPQLSGLQVKNRVGSEVLETDTAMVGTVQPAVSVEQSIVEIPEETEDQRALHAILAGGDESAPVVEIIPVPSLSETDALKQDVQELPDAATTDDYERVPISAFGAAMLRGMGWTDGAVAPKSDKRRRNALSGLYLPQARPALLGIGAKEQVPEDDGSGKKRKGPDMRYVPVARKESGRGENASSRSGTVSRGSRSPSRQENVSDRERSGYHDRERRRERDRDRDRDRGDKNRQRIKDYDYDDRIRERRDYRDRDRSRDQDVEKDRSGSRGDRYHDRERYEKGKQYDQRERDRRDRRDDK